MKNLRHASLGKDVKNKHTKFYNDICKTHGDIIAKKKNRRKNQIFNFHSFYITG